MNQDKSDKLINLANELLSQVRAEALVSLRFLDVALYKLKFNYDFNTTIYTDGEYLYVNPYYIFSLYKGEFNLLLRNYLHVILHCIFFHLYVDKNIDIDRWNLACDISVENIINELNLPTLVPDMQNPQIPEINRLKQLVGDLTAEKLYNFFMVKGLTYEEIERLKVLFLRDDHISWFIKDDNKDYVESKRSKADDSDYKEQNKKEKNDNQLDNVDHENKNKDQESNNNEDYNKLLKDNDEMKEDEEKGDEGSNLEGEKNKSDEGEEENENADSTNKSDINEDSKNEEARVGGMEVKRPVDAKNVNKNLEGDESISIQNKINEQIGKDNNETINNSNNKKKVDLDDDFNLKNRLSSQIENAAYNDWKKISERVKEDLLMFSNNWGDSTNTLRQYLKEVNRERHNYESFLRKFSVYGENIELNDEEFDNIYYTYGLNIYKNIPLVEPLEYKEVNKIKEFVIAIDVSGSVKGELVQKFIEKTYNILCERENFYNKVNIHIILCDTEIKKDFKITNLDELKQVLDTLVLEGFGGTDFRPVFNYVDELKQKGEFNNLKGLIYFTDGLGDYPSKIPDYDTAFCFLKSEKDNEMDVIVPPWAIKIIMEDL